ncbi:MAG: SpoIIE family protein phosphatase [Bacteroidota bacterium]|nr:SpoIIE family protein phosphatase [Bacteroidota bacterium]MDP3145773.1 SpoIIE family protein phosphatase [Bacteroidota bacterium]MDP3556818.1 SpoIIE family protein phosphatase [Bacteroidota bacterium]
MSLKKIYTLLLIVFASINLNSQTRTQDSLLRIIPQLKEDSNKVNSLYKIGSLYDNNKSKERFEYFVSALNLAKKIKFQAGVIRISKSLINNLTYRGLYEVALEYYFDYMKYAKENNLQSEIMNHYKIYAILLSNQDKYSESLFYNFKALNYYDSIKNKTQYATALNNICLLHLKFNYFDSAYIYGIRAAQVFRENNNQSELANITLGLAEIKLKKGDLVSAKQKAMESLEIYHSINYPTNGPGNCHEVLGDIFFREQKFDSAIANYNHSIELLKGNVFHETIKNCHFKLSQSYFAIGKTKEAYLSHLLFTAYNDSVSTFKFKAKALEMDVKYGIAKKESELKDKEALITEQNNQRNLLLIGIVLVLLLLFISYRGYKQKKKANTIISEQKALVDEKQKEILDSIHYAKRIQNTLLAHDEFVNKFIPDNFILFKPKDIVSGDFYWATKKEDNFYLAVCDSTGHGVPGAFMSLLNISFLNEAITEKNITEPNKVLDHVRKRLIENISQQGGQDGMDAILLCINTKTNIITYSAANNAPVLIHNNIASELEKDKMPVGKGEKSQNFTLQTIDFTSGDSLYLYTDGFADQFGGPKGKKYKYKKLNDLLVSVANETMEKQNEILTNTFNEWKGTLDQVDDVCLIGIKL